MNVVFKSVLECHENLWKILGILRIVLSKKRVDTKEDKARNVKCIAVVEIRVHFKYE